MRMNQRRSLLWNYYSENAERTSAACTLCNLVIRREKSGSTSGLRSHLLTKHPAEAKILIMNEQHPSSLSAQPGQSCISNDNVGKRKLKICDQPQTSSQTTVDGLDEIYTYFIIDNISSSNSTSVDAICRLCKKTFKFYGLRNLKRHLEARHKSVMTVAGLGSDESTNSTTRSRSTPLCSSSTSSSAKQSSSKGEGSVLRISSTNTGLRDKMLDEKVTSLIALDCMPVSIVESQSFIDLMTVADSLYTPPSKERITSQLLPNLYEKTMGGVLKKIEGIDHIALSTDTWSPRDNEMCLSVMAYFISSPDWVPRSVMLRTTTFIGKPTANEVSLELQRIIAEWNMTKRVIAMVADNETYTCLANEQLPWPYVPCFGHLIHLVVTEAIAFDDESIALIQKVKDIICLFQYNQQMTKSLIAMQKQFDLPEHKLIMGAPKRWKSIYLMFERVSEQMEAVDAVLEAKHLEERRLSEQDREIMGLIITSLKPFIIAATTLSSSETSTISMLMPLAKGLLKIMNSLIGGKEVLVNKLKEGLVSTFGKMEEIEWIIIATLLDPRFKRFPFAEKEAIQKAKDIIISEVSILVEADENGIASKNDKANLASSNLMTENDEDGFWDILDFGETPKGEKRIVSPANREVQCYLESLPIPGNENPLLYWKQHQEMFPNLYKVALKYMSVPITSVPFDRLDTTKLGSNLVDQKSRINSDSEHVNMILFLKENM